MNILNSKRLFLAISILVALTNYTASAKDLAFEYNQPSGNSGKPSNLKIGEMPLAGNLLATTRYGSYRTNDKGQGRPHAGIDIVPSNGGTKLLAIADGVVVSNGWMSGGGNYIRVKRSDNNDVYQYLHLANKSPIKVGTPVKTGDVLGTMGNTGISYGAHLHLDYGIPLKEGTRARNAFLGNGNAGANANPFKGIQTVNKGLNALTGYYPTDPTPYLKDDIVVRDPRYRNFLGSTIRQQFNILYGANLPVGRGATQPKITGLKFQLPQGYGASDEQLAKVNESVINAREEALANGEITEDQAYSPEVSYRELEDIFKDTGQIGEPEPIKLDVGDDKSVKGYLNDLAFKRFASSGWAQDIVKASNRSLWVEFLNMEVAKNHIKTELMAQNERIESLLASYAVAKARFMQGKIEALRQAIDAGKGMAMISRLELADLPPTASDHEVINAVSTKRTGRFSLNDEQKREIIRVSKAIGVNPNDLAAAISYETISTFSPKIRNPDSSGTGLIQFMQYTDGTGKTKNQPEHTWDYWGMTRTQFGNLSFTQQMVYVEKYFKDRGFKESKQSSLAQIYAAIMGVPKNGWVYSDTTKEIFEKNPSWNPDKNNIITIGEVVASPKFKAHQRIYFPEFHKE
ncbi:M23 family metallopeptidase [Acinetobacter sp. Marseille-Q1618]|uniref:M23 family metallopeptidase n=1 Tax=Acinetobacter sp. Marseille-Q1618 TaxID=2697502 RepID=UPI00156E1EC7|nr:M23 family metallopeptidase [Acinetobacter sp. Marseille-Q1618]